MEFKHKPIMLKECLDGLDIKSNGIYFDGTLGGAGHSSEILKRLKKISNNFIVVKDDFKNFSNILKKNNIEKLDGVLLDLGVSSYQLDNAERGFSYRFDAMLDMRMDKTKPFTAKDVVNTYSLDNLAKIFFEYGEEPFSKQIAKNIVEYRQNKEIKTTYELVEIIKNSVPKKVLMTKGHPAKRIFQAIRIEVNGELENLEKVIKEMINSLKPKGRIAIITFHSLEDRIVKNVFKESSADCICPKEIPICICNHKASIKLVNKKPYTASNNELEENSRSSCAKLRIAEKI